MTALSQSCSLDCSLDEVSLGGEVVVIEGDGVIEGVADGILQDSAQNIANGLVDLSIDAVLNINIRVELIDDTVDASGLAEGRSSATAIDIQEIARLIQDTAASVDGVVVFSLCLIECTFELSIDLLVNSVKVLLAVIDISADGSTDKSLERAMLDSFSLAC